MYIYIYNVNLKDNSTDNHYAIINLFRQATKSALSQRYPMRRVARGQPVEINL